jgi:hypothetical protein
MAKAWTVGLSVLIAAVAIWAVLLELEIFSQSMAVILWLSPGVAAFAADTRGCIQCRLAIAGTCR